MSPRTAHEEVFEDVATVSCMERTAAFRTGEAPLRHRRLRFNAHYLVCGAAGRTGQKALLHMASPSPTAIAFHRGGQRARLALCFIDDWIVFLLNVVGQPRLLQLPLRGCRSGHRRCSRRSECALRREDARGFDVRPESRLEPDPQW
jgi:hypothetical protein